MVKLVYQTSLGPISLEYEQSSISVGSAADNDLVLPHASVLPYYGRIELEEEGVRVLSAEGGRVEEVSVGGRFTVGEVTLEVHHSGNTVGIPLGALAAPAVMADDPTAPFYCENCLVHFHDHEVKRIGIQGRGKHLLCPRCSRELVPTHVLAAPAEGFVRRLKRGLARWLMGR